jgi:hypothetical protein
MKNFEKSLLSTIFSMLCALLLQKHIQSHIPNNYKVINQNKMSHNTLCPCKIAKGRQSLCPIGVYLVKGIARVLNDLMLKSCSEMPCSGTFHTLKIATSFPEILYL